MLLNKCVKGLWWLLSYVLCEIFEFICDFICLIMLFLGSMVLMVVIGYGIIMDVDDLSYVVFDCD